MYEEHLLLPTANRGATAGTAGPIIKVNQTLTIPPTGNSISTYFPPGSDKPSAPPGAKFYVDISATGGTDPTLDLLIVKKLGDQNFEIGRFTQITALGTQVIDISNCPNEVAAFWIIGGTNTPAFEFEVHCSR